MKKLLGINWKTNLAAAASFLMSVPQFVIAFQNWAHSQPADWRGAIASVVIALGLLAAKDSTTHSTVAQVEQSTVDVKAAKAADSKP